MCDGEAKRDILLDGDLLSARNDLGESGAGGGVLETAEDSDVLLGCCTLEKVHREMGKCAYSLSSRDRQCLLGSMWLLAC